MIVTEVAARSTVRRDVRVDAVRGLALVSMYVAHCAPSAGPAHLFSLGEYATYPLFALLVGAGAEFGRRSGRTWWVGPLVRGIVLVAAAQLVEGWGAQVVIVLAYLGVLTWLTAPLARAPSMLLAVVGLASLAVSPHLTHLTRNWTIDTFPGGDTGLRLARFIVADWRYQLAAMLFFAVFRWDPWRRGPLEGPVAALVRRLSGQPARG